MKKIIGVLGVAVIAVAMFFSANAVNSSVADLNLNSLINLNVAHAEGETTPTCDTWCHPSPGYWCRLTNKVTGQVIQCDDYFVNP
ncbi:hypothetical protein [Flavobacterium undicola]|uniref:hypothetical protein n=1 Tax=Flavobacterium undicola TaxID=1932779 RepID=UPI001377A8CF|nr:hypothetical protein [Flavobacterium undicola]MBA0883952.1 hypothetical protein [Flavobacterium undicola]